MANTLFCEACLLLADTYKRRFADKCDSVKPKELDQRLSALRQQVSSCDGEMRESIQHIIQMVEELQQGATPLDDSEGFGKWALTKAAARENKPLILWLLEHASFEPITEVMDVAAFNGRLEVMKLLGWPCTVSGLAWAATNGHHDVVEWILKNHGHRFDQDSINYALDCAIGEERLELAEFLREQHNARCTSKGLYWAINNEKATAVEWILFYFPSLFTDEVFDRAISVASIGGEDITMKRKKIRATLVLHRNVSRAELLAN